MEKILLNRNLHVLELGAGCGIVGITLSTYFPAAQVILTDLPEASSILTRNLALLSPPTSSYRSSSSVNPHTSHHILDWSHPLPSTISSQSFNLVVVADCTYNPDVVPDLVSTLEAVVERSTDVLVLVAMKVRHESEIVFFELMEAQGFVIREEGTIALPVLEGEQEKIQIYGFQFKID